MARTSPRSGQDFHQLRNVAEELGRAIAKHRDTKWDPDTVDDPIDAELYEALVWAQEFEFDFQPPLDLES